MTYHDVYITARISRPTDIIQFDIVKIFRQMSTEFKHQGQSQQFPRSAPFEIITIEIFGPSPQAKLGSKCVVITTDR